MQECQPKQSVDRALELLTSATRRRLLRYFSGADRAIERAELAEWLRREMDRNVETLELELAHHHLPKLDDVGVIDYDHRSGSVRPTEAVRAFEPLLEACDEFQDAGE